MSSLSVVLLASRESPDLMENASVQRGIGVTEVLIAAFILSTLVVGGLRLYAVSASERAVSTEKLEAAKILSSAMEAGYFNADTSSWQSVADELELRRPSTRFTLNIELNESQFFNEVQSVSVIYLSRETQGAVAERTLEGAVSKYWSFGSVDDIEKVVAGIPL